MYSLPDDLINQLQKKYPAVNMKLVVNNIFQAILEKSLTDGSCQIREFGKFLSFSTHSAKTGSSVVRLKFKISTALNGKIRNDQYLIENAPVRVKNIFDEKNEEHCKDRQNIKIENVHAQQEAERIGKQKTAEKLALEEVMNILQKDDPE